MEMTIKMYNMGCHESHALSFFYLFLKLLKMMVVREALAHYFYIKDGKIDVSPHTSIVKHLPEDTTY